MVSVARAAHLPKLVLNSQRNPRELFDTIENLVAPDKLSCPIFSNDDCE